MQLNDLTDSAIRDEINQLTEQLDKDDRPTRPGHGHDGKGIAARAVLVTTVSERGEQTTTQVGESVELQTAEQIRAERRVLKARRRELRLELARRQLAAEAEGPERGIEEIEAHSRLLEQQIESLRELLKANAREADRARDRAELDAMPAAKRDRLRQLLLPSGVPSSSKIGTPGA